MQMFIPICSKIIHTVLLELEVWYTEGKVTPIAVQNSEDHHQVRRIMLSFLNKSVTDPLHTHTQTHTRIKSTKQKNPQRNILRTNKQTLGAEEEVQIKLNCERVSHKNQSS